MKEDLSSQDQALAIYRKQGGLLRTSEALSLGIHPRTLYDLRDSGRLIQLARGLYRLAELPPLEYPDIVTVVCRVPGAVICLISALSLHELTEQVPHEVQIALPRQAKPPRLEHPPIRVFRFSSASLSAGIGQLSLDGIDVSITSPAKTVVDCFKFRNKIGLDVAIVALKRCVQDRKIPPRSFLPYARQCRVEKVMRPYLEALI